MIYRQKTYTDKTNTLTALVPENPEEATTYHAIGQMTAGTPRGPQQIQFPFDIPGANVVEAFANLPTALQEGQRKVEGELRKQMLMVPGANGTPSGTGLRLRA